MSNLLVLGAFLSFALFLVARQHGVAGIAGWACIVLNLWSELPAILAENNFLYPVLAVLSLPFLAITAERLLHADPLVLRLTRSAAVATVIFVPFVLVSTLHDGLVSVVVTLVVRLITALGHHPQLYAWDVIVENGFYLQIILACTGILVIAMVLGLVLGERRLSAHQAGLPLLVVVMAIFFLNLVRVAVVFIAVSDTWFAGFPDPTGTGDPNFFWAHNVIAEGLSLLFMAALVWMLARIIPGLRSFPRELVGVYRDRLSAFLLPARGRF